MKSKDRISFIQEKFQKNLRIIEKVMANHPFEIIGTKKKPVGIKVKTNAKILEQIKSLSFIDLTFSDNKANGNGKQESYLCFRVIFQVQVEGKRKGNQIIEERFVLIKSRDIDRARKKVIEDCKSDEKPYLNSKGQFVKWTFDRIDEPYITYLPFDSNFNKPVEVFSELKGRRLKKENIWNGN